MSTLIRLGNEDVDLALLERACEILLATDPATQSPTSEGSAVIQVAAMFLAEYLSCDDLLRTFDSYRYFSAKAPNLMGVAVALQRHSGGC